jgi:hypothetical protein
MRTKLDEIVEEEIPRESHYTAHVEVVRTWGKRIAERAFRYGCERHALWVKSVVDASPNIVPAPAEEKFCLKCKHGEHDGICLFMVVNLNSMTTPSGTCDCGDRRRGKRRSGCEHGTGYMTYVRHLQYDGRDWTCGGIDRRSGKDRRRG